jgi:competence protein ComEC
MSPPLPRRPALPWCLAFIAGIGLPLVLTPPLSIAAGLAACASLISLLLRRRHPAGACAFLLLALLAAGTTLGTWEARRHHRVSAALLLPRGVSLEGEFEGQVVALPERSLGEERVLLLRGRPVGVDKEGGESITVRLIVGASPDDAWSTIEGLRSGDMVHAWCRIVRPRGYATPGSGDPIAGLRARGLHAVGRVKSARLVELVRRGPAGPRRWVDAVKLSCRARLDRAFGARSDRRAVLGAVLLGDRAALPPELLRSLRSAGLIHLVAISGLHVGLLAAMLFGFLRRLRFANPALVAVALALLPAFCLGVGSRPPVLRAALVAAIALAGRWMGRDGDALNLLAVVAAMILALQPGVIGNAGFQLSFLATAGILHWGVAAGSRLPLRGALGLGCAVSAGAYLAAAPVAAWHFRWLAPVALLSNLAAAPCCAAMLVAGYAALALHGLPGIGELSSGLAGLSADALLHLASRASGLPGASWPVAPPSVTCVVIYYLALLATANGWCRRHLWALASLWSVLALAGVWLHVGPPPPTTDGRLRVAVLDVGQGQAVALQTPSGGSCLIDAAGGASPRFDPGERVVLPFLRSQGVRRLALLAVSHGDLDHAGGAFAVLRQMEVGELWLGPGSHSHPRLHELMALAVRRGTALVLVERGMTTQRGGLIWRVLAPGRDDEELGLNDRSLVLLLGEPPARILLPGDLEAPGEHGLLLDETEAHAELLVLGHHGAADATTAEFLKAVAPQHVVASCGFRNRFGHPAASTLARVETAGAMLWRTDLHGTLLCTPGADGWRVEGSRAWLLRGR